MLALRDPYIFELSWRWFKSVCVFHFWLVFGKVQLEWLFSDIHQYERVLTEFLL
jgi:hypothetical protein